MFKIPLSRIVGVETFYEKFYQPDLSRQARHRIGRGRSTATTVHRQANRGRAYDVPFCGGARERARRARPLHN